MSCEEKAQLRRSLSIVTIAGMLAMVYMPCVGSAIVTDFLKEVGFQPRHIGILRGAAMIMFALQFVGAFLGNRIRTRKPAFMVLFITGRAMWFGVVLVAVVLSGLSTDWRIVLMLCMMVSASALVHIGSPIWFSWMGDMIPKRILNRYWGQRYRWLWGTWVVVSVGLAVTSFVTRKLLDVPLAYVFTATVVIGATCGIIDILLFFRVPEPQNLTSPERGTFELLAEPFRHRGCRSFIVWSSAYSASAMFAASFMIFYLLKEFAMPQWQAVTLSAAMGTGYMISAGFWGKLADRHGHRPLLVLCSLFKPMAPLAFFIITRETAVLILLPFFVFDSCLNAGMQVAKNGFVLKLAPRRNRSMFIAAVWSVPSIAGGIGAWVGGEFLTHFETFSYEAAGREWGPYHLVFLISAGLRGASVLLAHRIQEPTSTLSRHVFVSVLGEWPLRVIAFPIGFYRRVFTGDDDSPAA